MKKTLIVGLDAACWEYLDPIMHSGLLPIMQRLVDTGTSGVLQSTLPAHTPTAWASIVTGKNPGKHGIFDHLWRRPNTYEFVPTNSQFRLGTPFWERLNQEGIRVGLVNVPFTHPPDVIDGFVVSGFGTPISAQNLTYPKELFRVINKQFGRFEPVVNPSIYKTSSPSDIIDAEKDHQFQQVQIAAEMANRFQVHVLVINLMLVDHANHAAPDIDLVKQSIIDSDAHIGRLIETYRPDNILLFSDHGSRRVQGTYVLHGWLRDQGYGVQVKRTPSERSSALNWLLVQWLNNKWGLSNSNSKIIRHGLRESFHLMPNKFRNQFLNKIEETIPFASDYVYLSEHFDFERTKLFFGASFAGLLYLNLSDRDPMGVVSSAEKAGLINELIEKLSQIRDPGSRQPLITNTYLPEDIYKGSTMEYGPDLILDTNDASCNVLTNLRRGSVPEGRRDKYFILDQKEFGRHSRNGIFVFSGNDFHKGSSSLIGHVMDIPATLLHLYDVPIPEDYDGHSLIELTDPQYSHKNPVRQQPGDNDTYKPFDSFYSEDENKELFDHLRALGYID